MNNIVIIGGGAAGLFAACTASNLGAAVTVIEKNPYVGKKLNITGKGRCNLTNNCTFDELIANIPQNPRFMYSAFSAFSPQDMMNFIENAGVPLKTERGNRVFPESDRARDITDALYKTAKACGAKFKTDTAIGIIAEGEKVCAVKCEKETYRCDAVILATGGASYPLTGSDGKGYELAKALGHSIRNPEASLVPLVSEPEICRKAQGITLKNVTLTAKGKKGVIFSELGEMMFTHFGMTGPLVLSASAHMRNFENERYSVEIDLKPALGDEKLEARILRDIEEKKNKDLSNLLRGLLPSGLIPIVLLKSGLDGAVKGNSITREMRKKLRDTLKHLEFEISEKRPISEAIITSGGVEVKEINPKTMESKLIKNLHFAGEILDVDAYTGGFNLQIAWSSAYLAASHAAKTEN